MAAEASALACAPALPSAATMLPLLDAADVLPAADTANDPLAPCYIKTTRGTSVSYHHAGVASAFEHPLL